MSGLYVYPIGIVEELTGLTARRIRYYEQKGLVKPKRSAGGHRLFSDDDIQILNRIKSLLDGGIHSMESVNKIINAGLDLPSSQSKAYRHKEAKLPTMHGRSINKTLMESDTATYFRRSMDDRNRLHNTNIFGKDLTRK